MQAMNTITALQQLLERHPLVFVHLVTALGAFVVGLFIMFRPKGTGSHKALGWTWAVLMGSTALASAFMRDYQIPNLAGITPIHGFTALVAVNLPRGIWQVKHGNIAAHRKTMKGLFIGACLLAGLFTLLPGRFLGRLLFQALGLAA